MPARAARACPRPRAPEPPTHTPAARAQVGRTLFKKVCRREGIDMWPQTRCNEVSLAIFTWFPSRAKCRSLGD